MSRSLVNVRIRARQSHQCLGRPAVAADEIQPRSGYEGRRASDVSGTSCCTGGTSLLTILLAALLTTLLAALLTTLLSGGAAGDTGEPVDRVGRAERTDGGEGDVHLRSTDRI